MKVPSGAAPAPPPGSGPPERSLPWDGGRDPGLQPERTRLAWRRTTLAFTVAAVLAGRQVASSEHGGLDAAGTVVVALSVLISLVFLRAAHRRIRVLGGNAHPAPLSPGAALLAAGCTVALAAFASTMVL